VRDQANIWICAIIDPESSHANRPDYKSLFGSFSSKYKRFLSNCHIQILPQMFGEKYQAAELRQLGILRAIAQSFLAAILEFRR
jgi:hypothetical protein